MIQQLHTKKQHHHHLVELDPELKLTQCFKGTCMFILLHFINKNHHIMNHPVKKTKTRSCLQPQKQPSSNDCDYLKYIIIDSENQEEVINRRLYDTISNAQPIIEERRSVIMKSKGSTVTNFLSNNSEYYCKDMEIASAEKEVKELKKECQLLEKLISDMIEEQAVLKVSMRKKERRQSMQKQNQRNQMRRCLFNYQPQAETQQGYDSRSILKENLNNSTVQDPISLTTPMISKAIQQKLQKKSLQIIKTVEIKSNMHQRSTQTKPKKPKPLKQKSASKPKQSQSKVRKSQQKRKVY